MKTIKSYTDVSQSKKLAEILPLESADMTFRAEIEDIREETIINGWKVATGTQNWKVTVGLDIAIRNNLFSYRNGHVLPCWSLTALRGVLPKQIGRHTKTLYWFDDAWHCEYVDEDSEGKHEVIADNPVDACYEMIVKLKEQKLL